MSDLLDADHDGLGRLQGGEALDDVDDPQVDVVLGGGFRVTLHEVRGPWPWCRQRLLVETGCS